MGAGSSYLPEKAIRNRKAGVGYRIKFERSDWAECEIAIEIIRDAGGILTKTGRRAQIGICGFPGKLITE